MDSENNSATLLKSVGPKNDAAAVPPPQAPVNGPPDEIEYRRQFVKDMVRKAWQGAKTALGDNSILSIKRASTERISFRELVSQDSLVNAMTTFAVTGMEAEFEEGVQWVNTQLQVEKLDKYVDVSRVITNYIGGLMSCFALTWNRVFLDKAEMLANMLEPAYKNETGLPYNSLNPVTGETSDSLVWLSNVFTGYLEYAYLSEILDNPRYKKRSEVAFKFLGNKERPHGLYLWKLDVETGEWATTASTFSFPGRTFFANLVKGYWYSNKKDTIRMQMYLDAMEFVEKKGMLATSRSGLLYARDFDYSTEMHDDFMSKCSCYLGGLFALSATALQGRDDIDPEKVKQQWNWARGITETCHEVSKRTATKLIPARFYFNEKEDGTNNGLYDREHSLSSEVAETYFLMWRLTKDPKYREYAWELAQSIEQHCLDQGGYWDLLDACTVPSKKAPFHDPHLISGTLKFLYLTFCEDHVLPLDQWVFNSAGNPFPIGAHDNGLQLN